jgi:uncharacterized metal-binding protein
MESKCMCEPSEVLLFTCSGASNVGQIANQAAVMLAQDGVGRMFCLAGIGGQVPGMIESTKAGKMIVALDGCPVACAKKTLEHAGFRIDEYLQVTEMGLEKAHHFNFTTSDVAKTADYLANRISRRREA